MSEVWILVLWPSRNDNYSVDDETISIIIIITVISITTIIFIIMTPVVVVATAVT